MSIYERVQYKPEGATRAQSVILRDPQERGFAGGTVLTGLQVDRSTDEVASTGVDQRLRLISIELVTSRTRLVVDRHTGLLAEPGDLLLLDDDRWVACSAKEFGHVGTVRHIARPGALTTVCGCTATTPSIWRRDSRKPACVECAVNYGRTT